MPSIVLDALRAVMNLGGPDSLAVRRYVGSCADRHCREQQHWVNASTPSSVILSTAAGMALASKEQYTALTCHALMLVGASIRGCSCVLLQLCCAWFKFHCCLCFDLDIFSFRARMLPRLQALKTS